MTNPLLQGIASGLHSYAQGGIIPAQSDTMPNMNGYYPLSNIQRTDAAYDPKLSFAHPSELLGSGDTNIDPFTGEEKFDEGGAVAMSSPTTFARFQPGFSDGQKMLDEGPAFDPYGPGRNRGPADDPYVPLDVEPQPQPAQPVPQNEAELFPYQQNTEPDDNAFFSQPWLKGQPTDTGEPQPAQPAQPVQEPPPTPVSGPSGPAFAEEYDRPYYNPFDVERQPQPAQPVQSYSPPSFPPQERGPIGRQPWINPPNTYHPLPALQPQTGGIGDYVNNLNKEFAAAPRYKDNAGIDWTSGGGSYVGGTGGGGGGGGGGGDDSNVLNKYGPGALILGGKVYKNWPAIKAGWNKLTGKPPTGLTPEEQALYDQNQKTQTPTELKTAPTVAGTTALVGSQLENLFAAQPSGSVGLTNPDGTPITEVDVPGEEPPTDQPADTGQTTGTDLTTDFSGLDAAGAAAAGTGISSLLGSAGTGGTTGVGAFGLEGDELLTGTDLNAGTGQTAGTGQAASTGGANLSGLGTAAATGAGAAGLASLLGSGAGAGSAVGIYGLGGELLTGSALGGAGLGAGAATGAGLGTAAATGAGAGATGAAGAGAAGGLGAGLTSLASTVGAPLFAAYVLAKMMGVGEAPATTVNPLTGEMILANSDEGKALRAAQDSDSYKASDLPSGPYGSLGMSPEAGYYAKQNQMRDLANQMSAAGYSGYDKYKNVNVNDLPAAKAAGSNWTPGAAPDYSGGNIADFTPDQLEVMKKFSPEYYRALTNPAARSANTDAELQKSLEAQLATEGRREAPIDAYAGEEEFDDLPSARRGKAAGGLASLPEYKAGGLLHGPGDGMSDSIPAVIKGEQPQRAALADGEFVVPADVVSHLGNGSTKAGSARLYEMMDKISHARTGNSNQGKKINPHKFLPV